MEISRNKTQNVFQCICQDKYRKIKYLRFSFNKKIGGQMNLLSREEMKQIKGGDPQACTVNCPNGQQIACVAHSSCHTDSSSGWGNWINCDIGGVVAGCWMLDDFPGEST